MFQLTYEDHSINKRKFLKKTKYIFLLEFFFLYNMNTALFELVYDYFNLPKNYFEAI